MEEFLHDQINMTKIGEHDRLYANDEHYLFK